MPEYRGTTIAILALSGLLVVATLLRLLADLGVYEHLGVGFLTSVVEVVTLSQLGISVVGFAAVLTGLYLVTSVRASTGGS